MRAGYTAVALAIIGSVLLVTLVLSAPGSSPGLVTVEAALGLDTAGADLDHRRAEAVAVLTTRCMAALGITYDATPEPGPLIPDAGLDPVAWAERWGFGVTTSVGLPGSSGEPDLGLERLAGLDPAERERVRLALDGDGATAGCRGKATEEVMGLRDRILAPIRGDLDALERSIEADPQMSTVLDGWRRCLATSGIVETERVGFGARLIARFASALETHPGADDLAALQMEERRVATAAARCEMSYIAARTRVAAPHESALVRRLGARLREIGAAIRGAEAALPTWSGAPPSPSPRAP